MVLGWAGERIRMLALLICVAIYSSVLFSFERWPNVAS